MRFLNTSRKASKVVCALVEVSVVEVVFVLEERLGNSDDEIDCNAVI